MAVQNGADVEANYVNSKLMSRTQDTGTTGVIDLNNTTDPDSGPQITNIQQAHNETFDAVGMTGIDDVTRNTYSSNNYVNNGDDRKVAVGKLDQALADHVNDTSDAHDASSISNVPSGNLAATDIQAAVNELQSDIDTRTLETDFQAHLNDTTDAHDASAISVVPTGNLAADDVQEAVVELQVDIDGRPNVTLAAIGASPNANGATLSTQQLNLEPASASFGGVVTAGTQTFAGVKTFNDQTQHEKELINKHIATPSNPSAGYLKFYAKSDDKFYKLTSAGVETEIGGSSSSTDQSYEISNLALSASVAGNALTIALKTKAGSDPSGGDPVKIGFRHATLTNGTYNQRSVTSALSVTISSGSTLGHTSGNNHWIHVYALDNAGSVELAISHVPFYDEGTVHSTTAEGGAGAADSNRTLYSTTARSNVPIRLIGRMKSNQTTAGTWAATPTEIAVKPFDIENVSAKYSNSTTAIGTTDTTVVFTTKVFDPYAAYSSGVFTCPTKGKYKVSAQTSPAASVSSTNANRQVLLRVAKNGTTNSLINNFMFQVSGVALEINTGGSTTVDCVAGDTLEITKIRDSDISAYSLTNNAVACWGLFERIGDY